MQKLPLSLLLFFCYTLSGQSVPVLCDNAPMLIFNDSLKISRLHLIQIDSTSNTAYLEPFTNTSGNSVNAIGYRLQDKMIYGSLGDKVVRIDGTGSGEILATIGAGSVAGDVTPDGKYLVFATLKELTFVNLVSGNYEVTTKPYTFKKPTETMVVLDIAFNPSTGILYAFDTGLKKLVTINPATGFVDNARYPPIDIEIGFPSLFFDSYGNLWGTSGLSLHQISTVSGKIVNTIPVDMHPFGRLDGCSCPGSFNFQKSAWPDTISHCGVMDFIFSVSNRTGQTQQNVEMEDWMPDGLTIEKIVKNPFGGQILSADGTDHLLATGLSIPDGVDSLIVRVRLDQLPTGTYKNQATIRNIFLNSAQAFDLVSDNPATHTRLDSTTFFVKDLEKTLSTAEVYFCDGDLLTLDASTPGGEIYQWDSGEKTAQIKVDAPGEYVATIETRCEIADQLFNVIDATLHLDLGEDQTIQSGDTLDLEPEWSGIGALSGILWTSTSTNLSNDCRTCIVNRLFPVDNTEYTLQFSNEYGCKAFDDLSITVERDIYIPNVFAPSRQSPDNVFFIQSKNPTKIAYLRVYDRWGDLVFERQNIQTNDLSAAWDGTTNNEKQKPGVYVWMASIEHDNGRVEKFSGDVTLLK